MIMKKLLAAFIMMLAALVCVAVYYSPLESVGLPVEYENNTAVKACGGICYPAGGIYRVDISGDESAMYAALERMSAKTVKADSAGGALVVYAFSPRVAGRTYTCSAGEYNVMAAYRDGNICIATPILPGSY